MEYASPAATLLFLTAVSILMLIQLACFVMVIVKMFQNDKAVLGVVCVALSFSGIGVLIAFAYGWVKSSQWALKKTMLAWTICVVLHLVLGTIAAVTGPWVIPVKPAMPIRATH